MIFISYVFIFDSIEKFSGGVASFKKVFIVSIIGDANMAENTKTGGGSPTGSSEDLEGNSEGSIEEGSDGEPGEVVCATCGKTFDSTQGAKMHSISAHSSGRAWKKDMTKVKEDKEERDDESVDEEDLFRDHPTLIDVLKETLEEDPDVTEDIETYIINKAEDDFAFSSADLLKVVNSLSFKNYKKAGARLRNSYQKKIIREIRRDDQIILDDEWATLAAKQSGYTPGQIQKSVEQKYGYDSSGEIDNIMASQSQEAPVSNNNTQSLGLPIGSNDGNGSNGGVGGIANMRNALSGGNNGSKDRMDIDSMLDQYMERVTKIQLLQLMSQGDFEGAQAMLNGKQPKSSNGGEKKGSDNEALQKFGQALEGINQRIDMLEQKIGQKDNISEKEEKGLVDQIKELNNAREAMKGVVEDQAESDNGQMNEALQQSLVQMNEKIDSAMDSTGNPEDINELQAELQKKRLDNQLVEKELDSKKEIAREVSNAVKEGLNLAGSQIGKNVGNAVISGDKGQMSSSGGSPPAGGNPGLEKPEPIQPEPLLDNNGEKTGKWKFTCQECNSDVIYKDGADMATCETCGQTYDLQGPQR